MEQNYIARMRAKVGHEGMIFPSAWGVLWNENHDAILLEKRGDSKNGYGFPGGFLEYGESPMQAVVREFKEETNLDVEVVRLLGIASHVTDKNSWGDAQETLSMGFEVRLVPGASAADLVVDGDETLAADFIPVNPRPEMFVPAAAETLERVLTENEASDQPWLRESVSNKKA
ncbi:NUDIX domain-containing protein [Fructobacillus tropaeoli]|uniref:NTP pyrophosphohydrolase including oxidative damage repair enzymes n=1 Tax=Fructobacillus tropaeoli TaxID=709323 RepID=A0A3F3GZ41_9LACO|nr:NUDIX domain-containing protein [Fructobacillus tropaeoli]GAP04235.1 NTP pyrophosphohydrolase including oxidative damage repair enzymes [Fructobacillus tropaeoli]CAK1250843.1 ADP-ribose pyrophosphatase YjhB [Fructobacillus tropaeoli]